MYPAVPLLNANATKVLEVQSLPNGSQIVITINCFFKFERADEAFLVCINFGRRQCAERR